MLSYEKRLDLARKFVDDANIIDDSRKLAVISPCNFYLVENMDAVIFAYAADLELLDDIYDSSCTEDIQAAISAQLEGEDVVDFLDRHNIKWE
jgi:hypothetical protein